MPISKYDAQFGGKAGAAQEAYDAMQEEYGAEKGKEVFYGKKNKKKVGVRKREPGWLNLKRAKALLHRGPK